MVIQVLSKFWNAGFGGGRGIRTPETLTGLTVFKTAAFNHSAIPPLFRLAAIQGFRKSNPVPILLA